MGTDSRCLTRSSQRPRGRPLSRNDPRSRIMELWSGPLSSLGHSLWEPDHPCSGPRAMCFHFPLSLESECLFPDPVKLWRRPALLQRFGLAGPQNAAVSASRFGMAWRLRLRDASEPDLICLWLRLSGDGGSAPRLSFELRFLATGEREKGTERGNIFLAIFFFLFTINRVITEDTPTWLSLL